MLDLDFSQRRRATVAQAGETTITWALIGVALALVAIAFFGNFAVKAGALAWVTLP